MTREEVISGLKFTVEMFLFDPITGEKYTEPRNDMDKTTIDACRGAIKILEQEPILDKIRTEIVYLHDWAFSREKILRIIDKYKVEETEKTEDAIDPRWEALRELKNNNN